jgi:hypothetical protein
MKWQAIYCASEWGPCFDDGIGVHDNCNTNTRSWTRFGNAYTNDTALDDKTVFTGSFNFQVKEIEVFEITE